MAGGWAGLTGGIAGGIAGGCLDQGFDVCQAGCQKTGACCVLACAGSERGASSCLCGCGTGRAGPCLALSGLVWPCHAPLTWVDGRIGERIGGSVCGQLPLACSFTSQPPFVRWNWLGTRGRGAWRVSFCCTSAVSSSCCI